MRACLSPRLLSTPSRNNTTSVKKNVEGVSNGLVGIEKVVDGFWGLLGEEAGVLELSRGGQNGILDRAEALLQTSRVYYLIMKENENDK